MAAKQPQETDPQNQVDTYHRFDQVVLTAYYCRIFSWAVLVITILSPLVTLISETLAAGGAPIAPNWGTILALFTRSLATGLYRFIVLQALAQILYLLLDIEYNTRASSEPREASHE